MQTRDSDNLQRIADALERIADAMDGANTDVPALVRIADLLELSTIEDEESPEGVRAVRIATRDW